MPSPTRRGSSPRPLARGRTGHSAGDPTAPTQQKILDSSVVLATESSETGSFLAADWRLALKAKGRFLMEEDHFGDTSFFLLQLDAERYAASSSTRARLGAGFVVRGFSLDQLYKVLLWHNIKNSSQTVLSGQKVPPTGIKVNLGRLPMTFATDEHPDPRCRGRAPPSLIDIGTMPSPRLLAHRSRALCGAQDRAVLGQRRSRHPDDEKLSLKSFHKMYVVEKSTHNPPTRVKMLENTFASEAEEGAGGIARIGRRGSWQKRERAWQKRELVLGRQEIAKKLHGGIHVVDPVAKYGDLEQNVTLNVAPFERRTKMANGLLEHRVRYCCFGVFGVVVNNANRSKTHSDLRSRR